jgi:hypothetical protein
LTRLVSSLSTAVEEQKQREEAPLEWGYRILAFFISTIFFWIPVILAHRYYVEKGADARHAIGGRWAIYGLLFYVALGVLKFLIS